MYEYKANLLRVIDGDTYTFMVDLGFNCFRKIDIRIKDINTPEKYGEEKERGLEAMHVVGDIFSSTNEIIIKTEFDRSFSRYVADVQVDDLDLADLLVELGQAERVNV